MPILLRSNRHIQNIRKAKSSSSLLPINEDNLDKLESINNYSKKYHHNSPPNIDSDELAGYVEKALSLVGDDQHKERIALEGIAELENNLIN